MPRLGINIVTLCLCVFTSYAENPDLFFSVNPTPNIVIDETENITILCAGKKCISKCCPKNEHVIEQDFMYLCSATGNDLTFTEEVRLYNSSVYGQETNLMLHEIFLLIPNKFADEKFYENYPTDFTIPKIGMRNYLTEKGDLILEFPNAYDRWTVVNPSFFCVDYNGNASKPEILFWAVIPGDYSPPNTLVYSIGLLISSFFLSLVFVVYCILPELQNLVGKILMGYVFSTMVCFTSMATTQIGTFEESECIVLTSVIYFFTLSSFCWMNVMSYDIWWTFRGYAKARPIHRRGENFKFSMYFLYAGGIPLLMTIFFLVMNSSDLSSTPWIITPNLNKMGCFLTGGQQFVYMHVPMLIVIVCNWMFFLMTAFNIWRLNRGTAILDKAAAGTPAAHRSQKNRLMVYLKVSFIMGTNWILEIISTFYPNLKIWYITDLYNNLMGLGIFIIFICNRKIYRKLKEKFENIPLPRSLAKSSSSTIESNVSQELQSVSLQVSKDPRGFQLR